MLYSTFKRILIHQVIPTIIFAFMIYVFLLVGTPVEKIHDLPVLQPKKTIIFTSCRRIYGTFYYYKRGKFDHIEFTPPCSP